MTHYMYIYMGHELWCIMCIRIWVTNYDWLYVYTYESRTRTHYMYIYMSHDFLFYELRTHWRWGKLTSRPATQCNTVQHAATQSNTGQHVATLATHCNAMQHTADSGGTCHALQHNATDCNRLQQTATDCNTPHHTATHRTTVHHTATHCHTKHHNADVGGPRHALQDTATHCNTLQHTAAHCITLQRNATHRRWRKNTSHSYDTDLQVHTSRTMTYYTSHELSTDEAGSTRTSRPSDAEVQAYESQTHKTRLIIPFTNYVHLKEAARASHAQATWKCKYMSHELTHDDFLYASRSECADGSRSTRKSRPSDVELEGVVRAIMRWTKKKKFFVIYSLWLVMWAMWVRDSCKWRGTGMWSACNLKVNVKT